MTKHLVPLLSSRGGGSAIINMASVNAGIAIPGFVPYAMTKAAIIQLTRNSAVDLGKLNIRCEATLSLPTMTVSRLLLNLVKLVLGKSVQQSITEIEP